MKIKRFVPEVKNIFSATYINHVTTFNSDVLVNNSLCSLKIAS
jgi:hypothetical protein